MKQQEINAVVAAVRYEDVMAHIKAAVKTMEENPSALEVAEAARELRAFATVMIHKIERERDVF